MTKSLPLPFVSPIQPVIASFSYTDIADGTGIRIFYPGTGTTTNALRNAVFYSNDVLSSKTNPAATTKEIDLDFDVLFNLPQTIKGTAIITVPIMLETNNVVTAISAYVISKIRHWDGTTETDIVTKTSDTESYTGGGAGGESEERMFMMELTVPRTHFKKGETLRVTLELWCLANASAANAAINIGHDPKNRTSAGAWSDMTTTIAEAHIPFEIDI